MPAFVRTLAENWKLKALALALAVLLWVVVSAEEVTSNWIPVPLQVRVSDPEFRLVQASVPAEVEVRFSGPGRELWDLVVRRPPLVLSLTQIDSTAETVALDPRMVQVPSQLAVNPLDVRPGAVTLDFLRVETRQVPVRVRISGGPGEGWTLVDSLQVRPDLVRVSGLQEDLEGIRFLSTEPIALEPTDSVFSRLVALDTAAMPDVRFSATRVEISGHVDRVMARTFMNVPISVGAGVAIQPERVNVRITGPSSRVAPLGPDGFRVVISIDSIPIRIPPEGLLVPLRIERLSPGLQASATPSTIRLLPDRMALDSVSLPGARLPADTSAAPPGGVR